MYPFFERLIQQERVRLRAFFSDTKKAFDLLGNTYAPFFFCCALLAGITLPVIALKSGDVVNALLGARGIGVLTSELMRNMWVIVGATAGYIATRVIIARLSGKIFEVFVRMIGMVMRVALLGMSIGVFPLFLFHAGILALWHLCLDKRLRWLMVVGWSGIVVGVFFHLASTVALRVRTMGDAMSVLLVMVATFFVTTMPFLLRK